MICHICGATLIQTDKSGTSYYVMKCPNDKRHAYLVYRSSDNILLDYIILIQINTTTARLSSINDRTNTTGRTTLRFLDYSPSIILAEHFIPITFDSNNTINMQPVINRYLNLLAFK
jgi:hypothetical protein